MDFVLSHVTIFVSSYRGRFCRASCRNLKSALVLRRKAAVMLALRTNDLKRFEAYQRYNLSVEELRE